MFTKGIRKLRYCSTLDVTNNVVGQEFDAFKHFDQSLKILDKANDPISLGITHNNKAVVELK